MRASLDYVDLEDHWIPKTLEVETSGHGEPSVYARIEVSTSEPRLVELRFNVADPDARGIRQADLRDVQVSALVEDLVAGWTFRVNRDDEGVRVLPAPYPGSKSYIGTKRFVERLRSGRTTRDITPQLLERVASVYRENIHGHPTKAVQHHFQVSQRMAAEYVSRARKRGLLPLTKRGKKNA